MFQVIGYMNSFTACGNTTHALKRSKRLQIATRLIIEESALIARVPQIERYKIKVTKTMRKKINLHIANGYNHIEFQEAEK